MLVEENNPSWNLSTTQRKIAFPLRTHARTNWGKYLARFVAAEICGQRIRISLPELSPPDIPDNPKNGDSALLANPSKFVLMTYSPVRENETYGAEGYICGCIPWQFCIILEFLGFRVGGWNFSPTARSIVLFQLTFYFCFLFVFLESGDGTGTEAGHAWHSAWVAHYLMMLFAIFSHLSAWFLLVEFFTVSPAKVSVSCYFSFSTFSISFRYHISKSLFAQPRKEKFLSNKK